MPIQGAWARKRDTGRPVRESLEPSTVPQDTTQCEGERKGIQNPKAGVDGNRTRFRNSLVVNELSAIGETPGAESGAVSVESGAVDADLTTLIDAWPTLSADVKTSIIGLVDNSGHAPATD